MIGIFKDKNPANIFLILLFGVLIKLPMFLHPHITTARPGDSVLYKGLLDFLEPNARSFPALYPLLSFLLLFLQAAMLSRFINMQRMVTKPTFLPGMAYLLITSLFPEWNYFSAPLIINTILIYVLSRLFTIYNLQNLKGTIFNIGLSLGISSFLFFPSITFVIWVLLALMVMRPFRFNEWLICLLGLTTPFYFYAIYLFITGHWSWENWLPYISFSLPKVEQSAWVSGSAFLLVLPFLTGGYFVQDSLRRMLIHIRKGWSLLLLYLLVAMLVPFVNTIDTFENWVLATVPFAAFHACTYLYSKVKLYPILLFWITVAFIVAYQYYGPGW